MLLLFLVTIGMIIGLQGLKDFVGRIKIINDIFAFLKSVINNNTDTRLFAIKSPSGWGKSSIILKIADAAKSKRKSKSYYIYAVDVRAAMSSRYAELSFKACLEAAVRDNFLKSSETNFNINNVINVLNDDAIKTLFKQLKEENKLIVIIFDQFEETFSKERIKYFI